jgi:CO/xanthine dehydrogenase Mo-binding subunit
MTTDIFADDDGSFQTILLKDLSCPVLSENYPAVNGKSPWKRLDYRRLGVPLSTNAASVRVEIVEHPFPGGPYGAKGISEIATLPSTPAILNAAFNATGVRTYDLPINQKQLKEHLTS